MQSVGHARVALLEIDFQPWVIELGHDADVLGRAVDVRKTLRDSGALIVCTRYLSRDPNDTMRYDPNSEGSRFHRCFQPQSGDLVATKFDRDIWSNPDLDISLRLSAVDHIVVTGYVTDHGVDLAARNGLRLGYRVSVRSDACAGTTAGAHVAALESMAEIGIDVIDQD